MATKGNDMRIKNKRENPDTVSRVATVDAEADWGTGMSHICRLLRLLADRTLRREKAADPDGSAGGYQASLNQEGDKDMQGCTNTATGADSDTEE